MRGEGCRRGASDSDLTSAFFGMTGDPDEAGATDAIGRFLCEEVGKGVEGEAMKRRFGGRFGRGGNGLFGGGVGGGPQSATFILGKRTGRVGLDLRGFAPGFDVLDEAPAEGLPWPLCD